MKLTRSLILCLLFTAWAIPQGKSQTLTLIDTVQFASVVNSLGNVGGSDCWGYTAPGGEEYALMGTYRGIGVVRVSNMTVIDEIPGPQLGDGYYHRDIKTLGHYAYAVGEMHGVNQGIIILDLQYLPDSVRFVRAYTDSLQRFSHNISIDLGTEHLYVEAQGDSGIHIYSLADPENPARVGFIPTIDTHDMYARNDTVWVAEGYQYAYSIWDATQKSSPVMVTRITDPGFGYCHNIWPSEDGRFFFTTEETDFKTVKCWEYVNPQNIIKRGEYLGDCELAHNAHVQDGLVWISHYESGIAVVDFSDPDNPVELAKYDTYPQGENPDFFGNWGVYPHTANGMVYASNFEGTLFILDWDKNGVGTEQPKPVRQLAVAPNPFSEQVRVMQPAHGNSVSNLRIFDTQGRLILLQAHPFQQGDWIWNGQDEAGLPVHPGVYFLQLESSQGEEWAKVIKL